MNHMIFIIIMAKWYGIGIALQQTTVLAAQRAEEWLGYHFWQEHESSGQFCEGPQYACTCNCVRVVYHD